MRDTLHRIAMNSDMNEEGREITIYCNNLEEVNRELELLLRDHYSVVVEQAENIWRYHDGRMRLTAKPNRSLAYKPQQY